MSEEMNTQISTEQKNDSESVSYYKKNKNKIKIQQKVYYQTHKKKLNSRAGNYYHQNKDKILESNKNSSRKKNYDKDYYIKNKDKIQQRKKYLYKQTQLREQMKRKVNS